MSDDDSQGPLFREPISITDETTAEDLTEEIEERLSALLSYYNCDASPEGWRDLALRLALEHEPAMKIETPADRKPGKGGREPGFAPLMWRSAMRAEMRKGATGAAAARTVRKRFAKNPKLPGIGRLKNLASSAAIAQPRILARARYVWVAEAAARAAADRLGLSL